MKKRSKQIAGAHAFKEELTIMTPTQIRRFDKDSVQHYNVRMNHSSALPKISGGTESHSSKLLYVNQSTSSLLQIC